MPRKKETIDPAIRQLIADLNTAGYPTTSSCQGKRSPADYEAGRHCDHAFITFLSLTNGQRRRARRLGLLVYNGGLSICPDYQTETPEEFIKLNLEFPDKIRELFELNHR